jgi:hypothetical protein
MECKFAACPAPVTTHVDITPECGCLGFAQFNVPVCTEHGKTGQSPKPHVCPTCGRLVHMTREAVR